MGEAGAVTVAVEVAGTSGVLAAGRAGTAEAADVGASADRPGRSHAASATQATAKITGWILMGSVGFRRLGGVGSARSGGVGGREQSVSAGAASGSAREARTQFETGYGDALITYELEGLLMKQANAPVEKAANSNRQGTGVQIGNRNVTS